MLIGVCFIQFDPGECSHSNNGDHFKGDTGKLREIVNSVARFSVFGFFGICQRDGFEILLPQ